MTITEIVQIVGYIGTLAGFLAYLWKIWRKIEHVVNGQRCLLRSNITDIYYKRSGSPEPHLREYERKNLDDLYEGYKALGGNHYIEDIYKDMRDWRVVS